MSLIMIETTVVMPPPPIPAKACIHALACYSKTSLGRLYSCSNQLVHISRQSTEKASNPEGGVREKETGFPPKNITKFAIQRLEGCQCQKIAASWIQSVPTTAVTGTQDSTHAVDIQDELFSDWRSLPIRP